MRQQILMVAALLLSWVVVFHMPTQTAAPSRPIAKLWVVRFDQVEPTLTGRYEEAARAWSEALKQAKMGTAWTHYTFNNPSFTYMLTFPHVSFADLDREADRLKQLNELMGGSKATKIKKDIQAALRSQRQEIWRYVEALSYRPEKPARTRPVPSYQRIHIDWVKPGMLEEYHEVSKQTREALAKVKHPFGYLAFSVVTGEGSYVYLWDADSPEQYYQGNQLGEVFTRALGKENVDKLIKHWQECVIKVADLDSYPRSDLSYVPEGTIPWLSQPHTP